MPDVNGIDALHVMQSWRTNTPGLCLYYVWNAYKAVGARSDQTYPTAYSAWLASSHRVPGVRDVPAGYPAYLGPRPGNDANAKAGDVMISNGDGTFTATDYPYNGVIGRCTLAQRERQTGRMYLGYTRDILGNLIYTVAPKPPTPPAPVPEQTEEDFMFTLIHLTDDKGRVIESALANVAFGKGLAPYTGIGTGGRIDNGVVTIRKGYQTTQNVTRMTIWENVYGEPVATVPLEGLGNYRDYLIAFSADAKATFN